MFSLAYASGDDEFGRNAGIGFMDVGNWQIVAALVCVAAAAGFLVRRMVALFKGKSGGCGNCPSSKTATSQTLRQRPLVSLNVPDRKPPH